MSPPWHSDGRSRTPFVLVSLGLAAVMASTNMPSPLYPLYEHDFGFPPLVLTLVFAVYALVLIPTLIVVGSLCEAVGYRGVLVPALVLAAAGSLLFGFAPGVAWLFVARLLQGLSVGLASAAFTAALIATEPHGVRRRASLASSLMVAVGGGLGPIGAGAVANYVPAGRVVVFCIEAGILVAGCLALAVMLPPGLGVSGHRWRPSLPAIPPTARARFFPAAAVVLLVWAVAALFLTLVPSYLTDFTGDHSIMLAGLATGLVLTCSAIVQLAFGRMSAVAAQVAGMCAFACGLALLVLGGAVRQPLVVLAAAIVAGAGHGLGFMGSLRHVNDLTTDAVARAGMLTAFYVACYLGTGIPIIGVGVVANLTSTPVAVVSCAFVLGAACLATAVWSLRARCRPT